MKEALFWEKLEKNNIRCKLCPHNCIISNGQRGRCRVRKNIDGVLYSENYEFISAINVDPIEKKPLYHFLPGKKILSIGSVGCNFKCQFCQNWEIAQCSIETVKKIQTFSISQLVETASTYPECIGVAFTYNEPAVWYEYMLDIAKECKKYNLKTVMVSNGYINEEPLVELIPYIDAFSIDLKAYTDKFYKEIASGELKPVLNTLKILKKFNKHIEIDFLLIPQLNDQVEVFEAMLNWIKENLGEEIVLHINRYFPYFKLNLPPTSEEVLLKFYNKANKILKYVYLGNIQTNIGENTYCPNCGAKAVERHGYTVEKIGINTTGECSHCNKKILIDE